MNMNKRYKIAGHLFEVSGKRLCKAVEHIEGFKPFVVDEGEAEIYIEEGTETDIPT